MRLLQVVDALPGAESSDAERYTARLAEALAANHEVAVATPRPGAASLDGATVHALPDTPGWTDPTDAASGLEREVVDERVEAAFVELLDALEPDLVHVQHLRRTSARLPERCRERDVPVALTLHDFWTTCHRGALLRPDGRHCDGPESVQKCAACYADALERADYHGDAAGGGRGDAPSDAEAAPPEPAPLDDAEDSSSDDRRRSGDGVADRTDAADAERADVERTDDGDVDRTDDSEERTDDGVTDASPPTTVDPEEVRDAVARRTARLTRARADADLLIAPSAFLRNRFVAFGTDRERIVHCRSGVPIDDYRDAGFDPVDGVAFGYVGPITHGKGVHTLVRAFGTVRGDAALHVFGAFDPSTDDYHAALADAADDRVEFHGQYETDAAAFRTTDVLVVPSLAHEHCQLAIQAAFASGVPVVASEAGGTAELVEHGHDGLTVPAGDPVALAESLQALVDDPKSVQRLRAGIESAKSLADHAGELEFLYEVCVAGDSPPVADANLRS